MKKTWLAIGLITAGLSFGWPASALLVGDLTGTEPDDLLYTVGADVHPTLSRANGIVITDLATQITTDGGADEYGGWLYYTNSTGFWKQKIGTTVPIKIQNSSKVRLIDMWDKWAVVSDSGTGGSYLYSAQTGARWKFTPKIKEISSVTITARGSKLKFAILGKNGAGKQKLFFSDQDPRHLVTEVPLPRYAKSCESMEMSPDNSMIFIGCTFRLPGKSSNERGYVFAELNRTSLRNAKRIITDRSYVDIEWLGNSKLATIEVDAGNNEDLIIRTIQNKRIASSELFSTTSPLVYNNRNGWISPFDVEPLGNDFYYTLYTGFTDNQAPYAGPTVLGLYLSATDSSTIISDNGVFRYFPN